MGLTFGELVPCRECHGRGEVRHRADGNESRERNRMRRKGINLPPVPSMDVCPECDGKGYLSPKVADRAS